MIFTGVIFFNQTYQQCSGERKVLRVQNICSSGDLICPQMVTPKWGLVFTKGMERPDFLDVKVGLVVPVVGR